MLTDDVRRLARETMDDVPRWNDDADYTVGVASEAASLLLRTTDEHLPDQVVLVVTQTANARSLTLAECRGFQNVGTFVEFDAEQWPVWDSSTNSPASLLAGCPWKTSAFSARSRNPADAPTGNRPGRRG